jgi:hypothetical protein
MLSDDDAMASEFYREAVATAARRAHADPGSSHCVYWDGEDIFVRISTAVKPPNSKLVCIAQHWPDNTVQVRFDRGRSVWVHV